MAGLQRNGQAVTAGGGLERLLQPLTARQLTGPTMCSLGHVGTCLNFYFATDVQTRGIRGGRVTLSPSSLTSTTPWQEPETAHSPAR